MNKVIEQPFSQKAQIDLKKFLETLEMSKKSTQVFRNLIAQHYPSDDSNQVYYNNALDHHSMVVLDSFLSSISMLNSCDFDGGSSFVEKRKLEDHLDDHDVSSSNSEVYGNQESPKMSYNVSGTRECYKKRKISCESREEVVTQLTDDGYAWRKYGQKRILKSHHPRHYYRCTHKQEQKCEAIKQIQQISENPIKYELIYHGKHTCTNNIFKTFPYVLDNQEDHSSGSLILSFDGSNQVNPFLFPVSPGSSDTCNVVIANNMPEMTNGMSYVDKNVSQQSEEISVGVADNCSSSTNSPSNVEENTTDYSYIMADFSEIFPDLWTD